MTQFQKGTLEGFGYFIGVVISVSFGFALCFASIGGLVVVWRWMEAIVRGGCP